MKGLWIIVAAALVWAASAGCCSLGDCGGYGCGLGHPHCADCASGMQPSMPPVEFH